MGSTDGRQTTLMDSVTQLGSQHRGCVVVCGSHGGRYAAAVALQARVAGIVLNDASVGRDGAGIEGLALFDRHGVPAATIDYRSARIGQAEEAWRSGVLSHVGAVAEAAGCRPGQGVSEAVGLLSTADVPADHAGAELPTVEESRSCLVEGPVPVWALDSASLARPDDAGAVIVTGSHPQLVGGDGDAALRTAARLAVFNDAGGVVAPSRLEALDRRRIPAVTVDAATARIGDARSSYFDGVVSAVNRSAADQGAAPGTTARELIAGVLARSTEAVR